MIKYYEMFENQKNDQLSDEEIINEADSINDILRDEYDMDNYLKPLFVSMILLAFWNNYEKYNENFNDQTYHNKTNSFLLNQIRQDAELNLTNLGDKYIDKTQKIIEKFKEVYDYSKKNNEVKINVNDIEKTSPILTISKKLLKIFELIQNKERAIDPIGIFYSRFLKYATGEGQDLGIVLTPSHITDLFCELVHEGSGLKLEDKIIDIAAGSGGFLISAYKKLIQLSTTKEQIEYIKEHSIWGIENDPKIYILSITNMILLRDGKTNLLLTDSLKRNDISKNFIGKANISFLNPPYSKKKDKYTEFDFIKRSFDMLQNSIGEKELIAILPLGAICKKETKEIRDSILEKNTLIASITMPDNLFYPAASVNTAILIFKPNKPHDFSKKVWMARLKDDGFELVKHVGRIDKNKNWIKIKNELIQKYKNKDVDENNYRYIYKEISINDEWIAEAHVKTDFTNLNKIEFEEKIKDYISYRFSFSLIKDQSYNKKVKKEHKLNERKWKLFSYNEIFDLEKTKNKKNYSIERIEKYKIENSFGKTPYISATEFFNGVSGKTEPNNKDIKIIKNNCITLSNSGSVGKAFYQEIDFVGTDSIYKLNLNQNLNQKLNKYIGLFLCTLIEKERYRYNFGRAWRGFRLEKDVISLPINENNEIDFEFMESFIKSLNYSEFLE